MSNKTVDVAQEADLRSRANVRLGGRDAADEGGNSASDALRVLHQLASSTETAPDALALLHEFQVYQVELDMQDENLRTALADLEADLNRQRTLYDCAPVACFTLGFGSAIDEPNLAAAELLGYERDTLRGQTFDSFVAAHSGGTLARMLARSRAGGRRECGHLHLALRDGSERTVWACVNAGPAGGHYRVALMDLDSLDGTHCLET